MAFHMRISVWKLTAKACGKELEVNFPVCNSMKVLPTPSIEEALQSGTDHCTDNVLMCIRKMKVIEQKALSRTGGVSGPLTITSSVSGKCKVSPSFVSVLNAIGLFLSYNVTERYRQSLTAEREWNACSDCSSMEERRLPVLEFDHWDFKSLHAVTVDGKAMPKVNGSLLQGQTSGKNRKKGDRERNAVKRPRRDS
ncbi:hypothetical protein BWQ96_00042 [Gracilariopsis chorda]|uniref:Uncharacterized protein n=1 Tax=Gracilariopsis chorda TaxID=448386 RepID=A0A2V3J6W8_9FLOR|nr:hypothetical protein BWQ96_00042 [Gracilariopsis chorda]|eukprot:PXF49882.1 hypothetical protein BWQ96_00042 [Gracilariopsis chorda]